MAKETRAVEQKYVIAACVAALCVGLSAGDLVWTGSASATWDKSTANWTNANGVAMAFADGDNVTIDTSFAAVARPTITVSAAIAPGSVTFNVPDSLSLAFSGNFGFGSDTGLFTKRGDGALTVIAANGNGTFRNLTGTVAVEKGPLVLTGANYYAAFGGQSAYPKTFVVEDGAELRVLTRNTFGKVDALNGCYSDVYVKKGGTFQLGPDGNTHCGNSVRNLTLDGGSLVFAGMGVSTVQSTLSVLGTFTVTGDVAQVVSDNPSTLNTRVGLAWQIDNTGAATGAARTRFHVTDVTADEQPDLTFMNPLSRGPSQFCTSGFIKTGKGTMRLASDNATRDYGPNGDIDVLEGTLEFAGSGTLSDIWRPSTVYVGTNATLHISATNAISTVSLSSTGTIRPKTKIKIDHGTLRVDAPEGQTGHTYLGDELVLDGATFDYALEGFSDNDYALGALSFGALVHFTGDAAKGDSPYTLMPFAGMANTRISLLDNPLTEIRVDDITGDSGADATIGYRLGNYRYQITGKTSTLAGGFVKTGAGTLQLTYGKAHSNFSGNLEVREGTLLLDMEDFSNRQFGQCSASFLGNMTVPERTVTVYTNAVVEFRQRNMLMYYTYGENGGNRITTPFVLQGGTVRFAGDNTANGFGPIVVDGGTFEYAPNRVNAWGVFNFRGTFRVTGSKAVTLPPCAYPQLPLYPSMACVFDVEDVTGDDRYDLDSWLVPCRPPEPSFYNGSHTNASGVAEVFTFGFIKRGAGTLALNRALRGTHEFDGTAQVEAGTLVVNDDFTRNHATFSVASGAFLGGTGTVYNAEIAAGGGFRQKAGNATPLKISGDLSIGANPVFRIDNPENLDAKSVKAVVFSATGTVTGTENLANATFYLDGELQKPGTWIALYSAGRCTVKAQSGTMLILR